MRVSRNVKISKDTIEIIKEDTVKLEEINFKCDSLFAFNID